MAASRSGRIPAGGRPSSANANNPKVTRFQRLEQAIVPVNFQMTLWKSMSLLWIFGQIGLACGGG